MAQLKCSDDEVPHGGNWIFGLSRGSSQIRSSVSLTGSAENINGGQCCMEDYGRDEKDGGYDGGCGEDDGGCD